MDKIKVGIPRALTYYYFNYLWKYFFEKLDVELVISPESNKNIMELGSKYSNDEMCLSLKNYLGHIAYLKDKCDYILIPRVDNYGYDDQTCTNFLAYYDIVNNLFDIKILNYNISLINHEDEYKGLLKIGKNLGFSKKAIKCAYDYAKIKRSKDLKRKYLDSMNKLTSEKTKILLVGHSYNLHDKLIGHPISSYLDSLGCEVLYSDEFPNIMTNTLAKKISKTLYWKYSKESIGSIVYCDTKIDGIVLLTVFPCGLDSIVNELVIRRVSKPCLNLVVDDQDASGGIETRLESFIDIVEGEHE